MAESRGLGGEKELSKEIWLGKEKGPAETRASVQSRAMVER